MFEELRGIMEKTSGIDDLVRQALRKAGRKIQLALIYGSIAKGTNRSGSDLDVLVVGEIEFGALVKLLQPVERRIGREISPRLYAPDEFRSKRASDRFLKSVLAGPTIVLMGDLNDAR